MAAGTAKILNGRGKLSIGNREPLYWRRLRLSVSGRLVSAANAHRHKWILPLLADLNYPFTLWLIIANANQRT
jgi:hypothetical protein